MMGGNERTLTLIAKAAAKLKKLDPEYTARIHRDRRIRSDTRRRNELRIMEQEHARAFNKIVRRAESDIDFCAREDVESIHVQDTVLSNLDTHINAPPNPSEHRELPVAQAHRITANGETRTLFGWSKHTGLPIATIRNRLKRGQTPEEALDPRSERERKAKQHTFNGESRTIKEWAHVTGICLGTLNNRLQTGWSIEDTLSTPVGEVMGYRSRSLLRDRGCSSTSSRSMVTSGAASLDTEPKQDFSQSTKS